MNDLQKLIEQDDFHEDVLADFAALFEKAADVPSLLIDYGRFSHPFAGCALVLAGRVHLATDIFDERHAAGVASYILAAAEDEYFDARSRTRITHRDLCHAMMRSLEKYGHSARGATEADDILSGYSSHDLFRALGFHVASEFAGSREFTILDGFLRMRHPELVSFLSNQHCGPNLTAYSWIELHVTLEQEHFQAAAEAVVLALRSYSGPLSADERWSSLREGFGAFFHVLQRFIVGHR